MQQKIAATYGPREKVTGPHEEDLLDDALDQTFPASDPAPAPRFD